MLFRRPPFFNLRAKGVTTPHAGSVTDASTGCTPGMYGKGCTYQGVPGRHIQEGGYLPWYQGGHIYLAQQ